MLSNFNNRPFRLALGLFLVWFGTRGGPQNPVAQFALVAGVLLIVIEVRRGWLWRRKPKANDGKSDQFRSDSESQADRNFQERIDRALGSSRPLPPETSSASFPPQQGSATRTESQSRVQSEARPNAGGKTDTSSERPVSFEELRFWYARPALALIRPYPPVNLSKLRSHIGGLPSLPAGVAWPRAFNDKGCLPAGAPLHFLGQVDLGEQEWVPAPFPKTGTLMFFGALPEGYYWGTENDGRVIFDAESKGLPTSPPEDLGRIAGEYGLYQRDFGDDDTMRSRLFPEWPLIGKRIETMPHVQTFGPDSAHKAKYEGYCETHNEYCAAELAKAIGVNLDEIAERKAPEWAEILTHPGFPWSPRYIALWARMLLNGRYGPSVPAELAPAITAWKDWADEAGSGEIAPDKAAEFLDFVETHQAKPTNEYLLGRIVKQMVIDAVGDSVLAAALPAIVFDFAEKDHSPINVSIHNRQTKDGKIQWEVRPHQLGGYVPSSQEPMPVDSERICLMQFQSDFGVNMMLCDVGEADFWIKPEDLARRDFSDVLAFTQGG